MQTGRASKEVLRGILRRINEVGHRNLTFNIWGSPRRYQVVDEDNSDLSAFLDGFQTCLYMAGKIKRPQHATR